MADKSFRPLHCGKLDRALDTTTLPLLTPPYMQPGLLNVTVLQCRFALQYRRADVILQYKRRNAGGLPDLAEFAVRFALQRSGATIITVSHHFHPTSSL